MKNAIYISLTIFLLAVFLMPKKLFFKEHYENLLDYSINTHIHKFFNLENQESLN